MKIYKKTTLCLAAITAAVFMCMVSISCSHDINVVPSSTDESKQEYNLASKVTQALSAGLDVPIIVDNESMTRAINGGSDGRVVYIGSPTLQDSIDMGKTFKLLTTRELISVIDTTDLILSLYKDSLTRDSIYVSESACMEMLSPLVSECKKYLIEVEEFTEQEIQEMLLENNVGEDALVPLILAISEENECAGNSNLTRCGEVISCATHALGLDLLSSLDKSALKTWGKAVMKKSLKTIAKRALGPIGTAIFVIEFADCMW